MTWDKRIEIFQVPNTTHPKHKDGEKRPLPIYDYWQVTSPLAPVKFQPVLCIWALPWSSGGSQPRPVH